MMKVTIFFHLLVVLVYSFPSAKLSLINRSLELHGPGDYLQIEMINSSLTVYGDIFCVHFSAVDSKIKVFGHMISGEYDNDIQLENSVLWVNRDFSFGVADLNGTRSAGVMKRDFCPGESIWKDSHVTIHGDFIIAMNYWITIQRSSKLQNSIFDLHIEGRLIKTDFCFCGCNGGFIHIPDYKQSMINHIYIFIGNYTGNTIDIESTIRTEKSTLSVENTCTDNYDLCNVLVYNDVKENLILISEYE